MKISNFGSVSSSSSVKKRGDASRVGSFADILAAAEAEETGPASSLSDVAATSALNNLLALQEISEEDVKRRKLIQRGKSLLDTMEKLRQQLLMGTMPMHILIELNRTISVQKQLVLDPHLNELMEDIELRAAVELAKLERAAQQSQMNGKSA